MPTPKNSLSRLIELAKAVRMTDAQIDEQRRSFVYGNVAFENRSVTKEFVDQVAKAKDESSS